MAIIDGNADSLVSMKDSTTGDDKILSYEEGRTEADVQEENQKLSGLVSYIEGRFNRAKTQRQYDEQRWMQAYDNYRGIYGPSVQFRDTEQSRAFTKVTKTKVLAAVAKIQEILFANNKFPVGIESSPVPTGIAESVHFDPKSADKQISDQGGQGGVQPSATISRVEILKETGYLQKKLEPVKDQLKEGPGLTPTSFTFEPAKDAAREMEKLIHDQLFACNADKHIRSFVFDMALYGTGIFKGPFLVDKEYPKWDAKGVYTPVIDQSAEVSYVSIWDFYPDPDSRNMMEAEDAIQRHKLSKVQLRELKKRPGFRDKSIEQVIDMGPNYIPMDWEAHIKDSGTYSDIERYQVLEYWGSIDKKMAEENGLELPKELKAKDKDTIQVNAWVCNGIVIRLILNIFTPARIPYYSCPYELNPYSFFGIGVAENMEDSQLSMNGFWRLAIDNAVKSANVILEIDTTNLKAGQDLTLFPGKVFEREGGQPGTAINAIEIPNRSQEAMMLFDRARQLADESTGIPSYSHGDTGVQGMTRTASGMSMLMGAAQENIKAVVRNIDDYLLVPLGRAMFAFNMQFKYDTIEYPKYIGDLEVVARGTESLMRDEVRSQKLLQFLQVTNNQFDLPYIKRDYALREIAASMDLDPEKLVNDPREAGIQAAQILEYQKAMGIDPNAQPQGGGGNPSSVPAPSDPTGQGGTATPGNAPAPGAQGSTASGGGSANAAMANKQRAA